MARRWPGRSRTWKLLRERKTKIATFIGLDIAHCSLPGGGSAILLGIEFEFRGITNSVVSYTWYLTQHQAAAHWQAVEAQRSKFLHPPTRTKIPPHRARIWSPSFLSANCATAKPTHCPATAPRTGGLGSARSDLLRALLHGMPAMYLSSLRARYVSRFVSPGRTLWRTLWVRLGPIGL